MLPARERPFVMQRKRRRFLANPFWRDWLLGAVILGMGGVLGDASISSTTQKVGTYSSSLL
jgi:hypothetical protein